MNKSAIRNFAVWAREKLINDISCRANLLGISKEKILDPLPQSTDQIQYFDIGMSQPYVIRDHEIQQRNDIADKIRRKQMPHKDAFLAVVEEIAYTWFNRFTAIRFMEINGYLPGSIRILSSSDKGKSEPDMVAAPFDGDDDFTPEETELIIAMKNDNRLDDLFRWLLIRECGRLHQFFPQLFEKPGDDTELFFNASFTDKDGVIHHLVNDIPEEDWTDQVQIIGWLYQYYNSVPKNLVFEGLKKKQKISKENIPAATQLFTPDWIVQYLVENSLGRLWLEGHRDSRIKYGWKYYLEEAEQEEKVRADLDSLCCQYSAIKPENISFLDPCMGSGHILVYAFDVLMEIYLSQGYNEREAAQSIVKNNLYGLDIDDRSAQIAYFAVVMKARAYDRRFLTRGVRPNLLAVQESNSFNSVCLDLFGDLYDAAKKLCDEFTDAKEYGSMIQIQTSSAEIAKLKERTEAICAAEYEDPADKIKQDHISRYWVPILKQSEIMTAKFDIVCTNPPYMGKKSLNPKISRFLDRYYPTGKSELYSAFMLKCIDFVRTDGFVAMVTIHTWMFIRSFQSLRKEILDKTTVQSFLHTGASTFEELSAFNVLASAFCLRKSVIENYRGRYVRLTDFIHVIEKQRHISDASCNYILQQSRFHTLPGDPLVYWISENAANRFSVAKPLREYSVPRQGMATSDNEQFVRFWFEVENTKSAFGCATAEEALLSGCKWFPYNKGGNFRKWYGMNEYVVNWENDGNDLKKNKSAILRNTSCYFKQGITWSLFGFENFGVRYKDNGFLFDVSGSSMFPDGDMLAYILAFLCSKTALMYLTLLAPTVNFQVGNIGDLPLITDESKKAEIKKLTNECIRESEDDWDAFEMSWNFKRHKLL